MVNGFLDREKKVNYVLSVIVKVYFLLVITFVEIDILDRNDNQLVFKFFSV